MEVWRHTEVGVMCVIARSRISGEGTPRSVPSRSQRTVLKDCAVTTRRYDVGGGRAWYPHLFGSNIKNPTTTLLHILVQFFFYTGNKEQGNG